MLTVSELRSAVDRKQGQLDQIKEDLNEEKKRFARMEKEVQFTEKARAIIQKVARETQQSLEYHVGELVSLALSGIFPDPYKFVVEFVERRNKTECDLAFERAGEKVHPFDASGGGAVDVASFALRSSIWSLGNSRNVLGLDEPFRFLSRELQPRACEMLHEISHKLGLQIIMVTHSPNLLEWEDENGDKQRVDRIFKTSLKKSGRWKITQVD
jgi:DNA repair exonuclease SbcCD ATPase subunit